VRRPLATAGWYPAQQNAGPKAGAPQGDLISLNKMRQALCRWPTTDGELHPLQIRIS
jgi:hypothetical protein